MRATAETQLTLCCQGGTLLHWGRERCGSLRLLQCEEREPCDSHYVRQCAQTEMMHCVRHNLPTWRQCATQPIVLQLQRHQILHQACTHESPLLACWQLWLTQVSCICDQVQPISLTLARYTCKSSLGRCGPTRIQKLCNADLSACGDIKVLRPHHMRERQCRSGNSLPGAC